MTFSTAVCLNPLLTEAARRCYLMFALGETTVQEYVDYVHSVAGKKKPSRASKNQLPVVTVRLPTYPDTIEAWAASFVTGVDQALHQRSVLQNEFLNVIITKERAPLQQPPSEVVEVPSTDPELAHHQHSALNSTSKSQPAVKSHVTEESAPPMEEALKTNARKRAQRSKTTSRFTGFDDYEPPPKKHKVESTQVEGIQESVLPRDHAGTSTHVRMRDASASPVHETVEKEEQMDILFPTAAKFKRQREATRAPSAPAQPDAGGPVQQPKTRGAEALERLQRAKAKADKDINVREQTRLRVKEEEDRRKVDEENLREALEGVDIAEMKNLAPIEEMAVLPREGRGTRRNQDQEHGARWNSEWNGRKNFKKVPSTRSRTRCLRQKSHRHIRGSPAEEGTRSR